MAESAGFQTIVLEDAYRTDDPSRYRRTTSDHHPNGEGHRRVAVTMFEQLVEHSDALGLRLRNAEPEAAQIAAEVDGETGP